MTQQISTGGGAGHLTGCTCPFCLSNATTAEVTDIDLVDTVPSPERGPEALSNELRRVLDTERDSIQRGSLAGYVKAAYPDASRFVAAYYETDGPDAYLTVFDDRGNEIGGRISPFRPENLSTDPQDAWHVDIAEAMRPGTKEAAARDGHRRALALLAEAYPEWNIPTPPQGRDLSKVPGMGKGSRVITENEMREAPKPGRMMMQRTFGGGEWTGPLSSNVVRIDRVTDRQVVVDYMDGSGRQTTSGGPMRPPIGVSAVDERGRVYLLNAEDQPFIAYDPMD
jgi:hypothetical protein